MYKYFTLAEFKCKHSGENHISPEFVMRLDSLREMCGFPFVITSGYRSKEHPEEAKKAKPGTHTQGIAADIAVESGRERYILVRTAIAMGFNGIGIGKDFVHVDIRSGEQVMWTY